MFKMSSPGKKTPKQVVEKPNSGKKLVQMRLPFQIIAPKDKETAESKTSTNQPAVDEPSTRKRALSFEHAAKCLDDTSRDQPGQAETKKLKRTSDDENVENEIIKISDSGEEQELEVVEKKPCNTTPGKSSGNVSTFQIKLPLSSKKHKRRKKATEVTVSEKVSEHPKPNGSLQSGSSDDIETIADKLNPQKRQRIDLNNADEKTTFTEQQEGSVLHKVIASKLDDEPSENSELNASQDANQKDTIKRNVNAGDETSSKVVSNNEIEKRPTQLSPSEGDESMNNEVQDLQPHIDLEVTKTETEICNPPPDITSGEGLHLTPKQKKLFEQRRLARQEKERKLQEVRLQKQQEKEQRELAKKREREDKDEERRKEREAKDEQKRVEREEKERKRLAEVEVKNEEKRKRNEAKEEEQRKKDDERKRKDLEKDEDVQKKKRASEAFTKFFVAIQLRKSIQSDHDQNSNDTTIGDGQLAFRPFQVKDGMLMSPITRKTLESEARVKLDNSVCREAADSNKDAENEDMARHKPLSRTQLYLAQLSAGSILPEKWSRSPNVSTAEDVQTVEDDLERVGQAIIEEEAPVDRFRAKFFKFHENRRPPYYGTWRKRTQIITARQPFAQDKKFFDYEIDSDDDWEEEGPGESLDGSDDDKEERESEEDDYEVDNKWFVPHGHLSDEELQNDEEFGDNTNENYSREAQKAKLQILQQEFAQEMKKETKKIKPRLIGCIWLDENGNQPKDLPNIMWEMLDKRAFLCAGPIKLAERQDQDNMDAVVPAEEKTSKKLKRIILTPTLLKDLIRLLHGNRHAKSFLISEFIAYLTANVETIKNELELVPAKSVLRERIDEFAEWKPIVVDELPANATNQTRKKHKKQKKRLCWNVSQQVLQKFEMSKLTLDNNWSYVLQPKSANRIEKNNIKAPDAAESDSQQSEGAEEQTKVSANVTVENKDNKKRVPLLMSVPHGQKIPTSTKNMLISQYLQKSAKQPTKAIESPKQTSDD